MDCMCCRCACACYSEVNLTFGGWSEKKKRPRNPQPQHTCRSFDPDRSVIWVNGALTALPEGETEEAELDKELTAALAAEHQYLQVRRLNGV